MENTWNAFINCEISLQLKWSKNYIVVACTEANLNPSFGNDTKLYVPVATLSTQENIGLLKQLESGFKRAINRNKYLAKTINQAQNRYLDFKDLNRRAAADKLLRDKAFNVAKDPKYDAYQRELASMVYKSFDKKTSGSGIKNENIPNKELAEEFDKPTVKNLNKRKSTFIFYR